MNPVSIPFGTTVNVLFYPPANTRFKTYMGIWKDLTPQELSDFQNQEKLPTQTKHMDSKDITEKSDLIAAGIPYQMSFSTLNWPTGTYTFTTEGNPDTQYPTVTDNITITPVEDPKFNNVINDMVTNNRDVSLYLNGSPISSIASLYRGKTYIFALNLNKIKSLHKRIFVDLLDVSGKELQFSVLTLFMIPNTTSKYRVSTVCTTENDFPISISDYPQGIFTMRFQVPASVKFKHSNDMKFKFKIEYYEDCSSGAGTSKKMEVIRDVKDLHNPEAPVPVNATTSLDTIKIHIVRFGDTQYTTTSSLVNWGNILTSEFYEATKKYFKLEIQGIQSLSMIQPNINQVAVENWYNSKPKTPGKTPLNLNNPDERLLATMLYYEQNQSKLWPDLLKVYTPRQNGEDVTVYLSDFFMISNNSAMSISESGYSIVPITDIYFDDYYGNSDVFFSTTNGVTTYHFNPSAYKACNDCSPTIANATQYVQVMRQQNLYYNSQNVTLHELGHTSWHHKMGGIRVDDFPKPGRPFDESYQGSQLLGNIYEDSSIHYFRNDEYMSGFRNRNTLDQTYGDILIERLLSRYGVNYRNYKYVFVPQMGHNANFGGIAQADAYCNLDSNKPEKLLSLGADYKAMLVGDTRRASVSPNAGDGQIDWVLQPLQEYKRADETVIGTTNSAGLFTFPLQNFFDGNYTIWTGLDQTWRNQIVNGKQINCLNWTSSNTGESGAFGLANKKYASSIYNTQDTCSKLILPDHMDPYNWKDYPASILCVEQ